MCPHLKTATTSRRDTLSLIFACRNLWRQQLFISVVSRIGYYIYQQLLACRRSERKINARVESLVLKLLRHVEQMSEDRLPK